MTAASAQAGVIFDCDGVLLDSMAMWHTLDDRIAERAGFELTRADRDFFTRSTLRECGDYLCEVYGVGPSGAAVERMLADEIMGWYAHEAVAKPGALAFVQGLDAAGVPLAVASSTPAPFLREGLARAGFAPHMRAIVSVEDVASSKREPLVYDTARAALGTSRAATWGFEDAAYALETLRGAGYRTVGVFDSAIAGTPEQLAAASDLFVASFTELTAEGFLALACSQHR